MAGSRAGGVAGYLIAALIGGAAGAGMTWATAGSPAQGQTAPPPPSRSTPVEASEAPAHPALQQSVPDVVERVGQAVVQITTQVRRENMGPFGQPIEGSGQGSGFVIDGKNGLVVTNNHVIQGATQITASFPDGKSYAGKVVGHDPISDVALVRLEGAPDLPQLALGNSSSTRIGATLIAIGNPFGLQFSVTVGVLSQVGREIPEGHIRGIPLEDLLQTDAAINPGNSGGPLMDLSGKVIGMNTAVNPEGQGLGFAVASNVIQKVVADLLDKGRVIRPWLGVSMGTYDPMVMRGRGLDGPDEAGVLIADVQPGQAAEKAGLRSADVVTDIDGERVESSGAFRDVVKKHSPGEKLTLKGFRGNRPMQWTVTLAEMPQLLGAE